MGFSILFEENQNLNIFFYYCNYEIIKINTHFKLKFQQFFSLKCLFYWLLAWGIFPYRDLLFERFMILFESLPCPLSVGVGSLKPLVLECLSRIAWSWPWKILFALLTSSSDEIMPFYHLSI